MACVTGTLPPSERVERVRELSESEGPVVLVATDCLSEGVNLQERFSAVLHYDLAWNPTRHEQREGRVDRFGQTSDTVRTVTLYGKDTKIDGIVLDVLLRKHEAIRRATGVSVPVPDSSDAVLEALMEGLVLRGGSYQQDMLDIEVSSKAAGLERSGGAPPSAKVSRTKFAQRTIHPEEVAEEVKELRANLGTHEQVREFTHTALQALGSTVTGGPERFTASVSGLPVGLQDALPPVGELRFVDDLPVAKGENVLHRTDPAVEAVASFVLESALDATLPERERPARRCAVVRTDDVDSRVTLLLVRYRFHLVLPARSGERTSVAEDVATLAFRSGRRGGVAGARRGRAVVGRPTVRECGERPPADRGFVEEASGSGLIWTSTGGSGRADQGGAPEGAGGVRGGVARVECPRGEPRRRAGRLRVRSGSEGSRCLSSRSWASGWPVGCCRRVVVPDRVGADAGAEPVRLPPGRRETLREAANRAWAYLTVCGRTIGRRTEAPGERPGHHVDP